MPSGLGRTGPVGLSGYRHSTSLHASVWRVEEVRTEGWRKDSPMKRTKKAAGSRTGGRAQGSAEALVTGSCEEKKRTHLCPGH